MKQPGKIAIVVFVAIILSVVILQAGRYSYIQDNGSQNFGPSGTSAFLELVQQSGYKVTVENSISPKVDQTLLVPVSTRNKDSFSKFLQKVDKPARIVAFVIPYYQDKVTGTKQVESADSKKVIGSVDPVETDTTIWEDSILPDSESAPILLRQDNRAVVAESVAKGSIEVIHVLDSASITNQHLDKANNASVAMGLIQMVAKPGERVTFLDTFAAQEVESSLLARLGPPFQAAWTQLLLLVLIIFVTLSVRFGLPPERRAKQRGGRELVDGLATMTRRKKNGRWALRAVFDRALTELERRHRIGREQIIQRPDLYMSSEDAMKLKQVEAATLTDITEDEAIEHAKDLKRLV